MRNLTPGGTPGGTPGDEPTAGAVVAVWEQGRREHPLDRALTILAGLSGHSRAELATLSIEQRDTALMSWRFRIFGEPLAARAACPRCNCDVEVAVSARDLGPPAGEVGPIQLRGRTITLRLPTSEDLAAAAACASVAEARLLLARRCTREPDRPAPGSDDDLLGNEDDLAEVEAELGRRAALSAFRAAITCPACGHAWDLHLDIGAFLWRELELLAGRLLTEVDVLARRYGWSEAEILGLSGARRRFYLGLAS